MEKNFVKCSECWRAGVRQENHILCMCRRSINYGCTKGVTTADLICALAEEIAKHCQPYLSLERFLAKSKEKPICLRGVTDKICIEATEKEIHRRAAVLTSLRKHKMWLVLQTTKPERGRSTYSALVCDKAMPIMVTFCCENCQEPIIVPKDMLKGELRFKCQACHQENHYDLS